MADLVREEQSVPTSSRLLSLDVLRGITIAFMILVNNGGPDAYWPFKHASWNGWTPTDLVFPTFLFVMGGSLVFSFDSRLRRGDSKGKLVLHTVKRFLILFLLGLVVNGFPYFHLSTLRIYGVLQRIALCFLVSSLLHLWDRRASRKVALVVAALLGYWALMRLVPVPGYGMPGRNVPLLDQDANIVAWLDRHIFPGRLYETVRDPEGLLSDIPALGTTLLGMLAGMWLTTKNSLERKFAGMVAMGAMLIVLGEFWNIWFPINKKLWTSSYVMLAAGISLVALATCYWAIEIRGWKRGWTYFWLVFGTNAIFAYVFSELLASTLWVINVAPGMSLQNLIYSGWFELINPPPMRALVFALTFVMTCWLVTWPLYAKRIFIKV